MSTKRKPGSPPRVPALRTPNGDEVVLRLDENDLGLGDVDLAYFEPGSTLSIELPAKLGAFATIEGQLVFERRGRHLVMLVAPATDRQYVRRVRCHFKAAVRDDASELVVNTLELSAEPDPQNYYEPFDGIKSEILRATRTEAIIALTLRTLAAKEGYLRRLLALDAKRPPKQRLFTRWVREQEKLRHAIERLEASRPEVRPRHGGRPQLGEQHYRDVAVQCLELYTSGIRDAIAETIGARYTPPRDRRTVADWIRKARHLGFLAPGEPGRVHFEPGPRLLKPKPTSPRHGRTKGGTNG